MNRERLKWAEESFLQCYPGGFHNPEIDAIARKHRMEKLHTWVLEAFELSRFKSSKQHKQICEDFVKLIKTSTLVSVFEKAKFKDAANSMSESQRQELVNALYALFHGNQQEGFDRLVSLLEVYKLAKWPIVTAPLLYYSPNEEVLVKPTTVKAVIEAFELEGIKYSPKVNYAFYKGYREAINSMKKEVSPLIGPDNGAFSGFLMMAMESGRA